MKILIYALGGGWGHLTRAVALARALDGRARILSNSPYVGIVQAASPELSIQVVSTREDAAARVVECDADVLVVDTFPRGLGGELADLLPSMRARKVLVHRALNPEYVAGAYLREFVAAHFDCVLCPGERGELANLPEAIFTAPWLIREPTDLRARVDVGAAINVVVCASGNAEEMPWYGETAALLFRHCGLKCVAAELPPGCPPELWIRYWPSIDWIANATVVIGGAGYNTVHECMALGVALIARPWPRKYDRQQWRAEQHDAITIVRTPQEACSAAIDALRKQRPLRPVFRNGSTDAVFHIVGAGSSSTE